MLTCSGWYLFQSTHPRRVWQFHHCHLLIPTSFNPHTHEGCDSVSSSRVWVSSSFNPHTHEGCDFSFKLLKASSLSFQSTHPRRVWQYCSSFFLIPDVFQSTHPRRVWLKATNKIKAKTKFQSTHPRRVWLRVFVGSAVNVLFQSTHPRRVWHGFGKDFNTKMLFQSTHPRRVWLAIRLFMRVRIALFQSTHPRRVWHTERYLQHPLRIVSIHTPTKGVTLIRIVKRFFSVCFNPHTHEGCDS